MFLFVVYLKRESPFPSLAKVFFKVLTSEPQSTLLDRKFNTFLVKQPQNTHQEAKKCFQKQYYKKLYWVDKSREDTTRNGKIPSQLGL